MQFKRVPGTSHVSRPNTFIPVLLISEIKKSKTSSAMGL